jgi:hypothetical protein
VSSDEIFVRSFFTLLFMFGLPLLTVILANAPAASGRD